MTEDTGATKPEPEPYPEVRLRPSGRIKAGQLQGVEIPSNENFDRADYDRRRRNQPNWRIILRVHVGPRPEEFEELPMLVAVGFGFGPGFRVWSRTRRSRTWRRLIGRAVR